MRYFKPEEFACRCGCGQSHMDAQFMAQIDNARDYAGTAFTINSGYRCREWNEKVGSTSENHVRGKAADIACLSGPERIKIVQGLIRAGFRRIGIAKTFIHADSMDEIESIWLY
jgi:zinc D-Ala-D-Ala carboxypeptidase